jgi:tRNA (cmo5U34)-methyltransferase
MAYVEWDPERYLAQMLEAIPGYLELQEQVARATEGIDAVRVLELGTGTGETARRVLERHPGARWTGVDNNEAMLERARANLPAADLRRARLEDPLPGGPFDLVVSALAIHHLDAAGKRGLFRRIAAVVRPGGRFVLGDVVVPESPEDAEIEIDWVVDLPDRLEDQLQWLREAGLKATSVWTSKDLAVVSATKPKSSRFACDERTEPKQGEAA